MKFGVYDCTYPQLEQNMKEANLYEIKNFWDQVLDFNWHKQDKSPNWDTTVSSEIKIVIGWLLINFYHENLKSLIILLCIGIKVHHP